MLSIKFMKGYLNAFRYSEGTIYTKKTHESLKSEKSVYFCLGFGDFYFFFNGD